MIQIEIDMEMPKRCLECRLEGYRFGHRCCDITCMPTTDVRYSKRLDSCPLHESVAVDHLVEADKKDDPISRQAAIDAVRKSYDEILDFYSDGHTVADSFEDILNALPSAESENTCSGCRYEEAYKTYNAPCANCTRWFTDWYERRTDDCI